MPEGWTEVDGGLECPRCVGVIVETIEDAENHDERWHTDPPEGDPGV